MAVQPLLPYKLKVKEKTILFRGDPSGNSVIGLDIENTRSADSLTQYYIVKDHTNSAGILEQNKLIIGPGARKRRGNIHVPPNYFLVAVTEYPGQVARVYAPSIYTNVGAVSLTPGERAEIEVFVRDVPREFRIRSVSEMKSIFFSSMTESISSNKPAKFTLIKSNIQEPDGEVLFVIDELKMAVSLSVRSTPIPIPTDSPPPEAGLRTDTMMLDAYKLSRDRVFK